MPKMGSASLRCDHPRAHCPRWIMTHVLSMAAFEFGNPIAVFIPMETGDLSTNHYNILISISASRSLISQNHFTLPDDLLIQPEPVFVGAGFSSRPGRSAQQPHPRRGLKHVRTEWAAIWVKLHAQISGVGDPRDLLAGIEYYRLRNHSNQYGAFSHVLCDRATVCAPSKV